MSGLIAYERCPAQYLATYLQGKPPPITPGMRRGTSVHSLIARHLRTPSLLEEEIDLEVRPLYDRFLDSRFNIPPVAVEQRFVLPFDRGDVHGRIDVVLPGQDGGLEIVDFKSGTVRSPDDLGASLQLPLYAMAAARRHDVPPELLAYTYYFLSDGQEVGFKGSKDVFERMEDRVERIMRAIEEGRFGARAGCDCYACRLEFGRRRSSR